MLMLELEFKTSFTNKYIHLMSNISQSRGSSAMHKNADKGQINAHIKHPIDLSDFTCGMGVSTRF